MSDRLGKRRRDDVSPDAPASTKKLFNPEATTHQSINEAIDLIERSSKILILVGAGISTSTGIPDFRSPDGLYAAMKAGSLDLGSQASGIEREKLNTTPVSVQERPRRAAALQGDHARQAAQRDEDVFNISDPQELASIEVFRKHPEVFYSFARHILPGERIPTETHRWIRSLEQGGKLLRLYTQNIDGLEAVAGIEAVVYCHGSFATASCIRCKRRVPGTDIAKDIQRGSVPFCTSCKQRKATRGYTPYMKPDITFFGEPIDVAVVEQLERDRIEADLLIVMGTSLLVPPVRDIPKKLRRVPQILINRDKPRAIDPEVFLAGDCDDVVRRLQQAGLEEVVKTQEA